MIIVWILSYVCVFILGAATTLGLLIFDNSRMEKRAKAAFDARMDAGEKELIETSPHRDTLY